MRERKFPERWTRKAVVREVEPSSLHNAKGWERRGIWRFVDLENRPELLSVDLLDQSTNRSMVLRRLRDPPRDFAKNGPTTLSKIDGWIVAILRHEYLRSAHALQPMHYESLLRVGREHHLPIELGLVAFLLIDGHDGSNS